MPDQTPVQIAWVTTNLDATETALSSLLGARKWVRVLNVHFGPDTCTYRGRPADFTVHVSFSYAGETQLELISPVGGDSVYTEFLDRAGPGLHHICVEADDVDAAVSGADVVQRGIMPGGMEFAYISAEAAGVPYIEVAHIPPEIRAFFDHIKQEQHQ